MICGGIVKHHPTIESHLSTYRQHSASVSLCHLVLYRSKSNRHTHLDPNIGNRENAFQPAKRVILESTPTSEDHQVSDQPCISTSPPSQNSPQKHLKHVTPSLLNQTSTSIQTPASFPTTSRHIHTPLHHISLLPIRPLLRPHPTNRNPLNLHPLHPSKLRPIL